MLPILSICIPETNLIGSTWHVKCDCQIQCILMDFTYCKTVTLFFFFADSNNFTCINILETRRKLYNVFVRFLTSVICQIFCIWKEINKRNLDQLTKNLEIPTVFIYKEERGKLGLCGIVLSRGISETDGINLLLAFVFDNLVLEDLEKSVYSAGISEQAADQVIKGKTANIFIAGLQGCQPRPDNVDLIIFLSNLSMITKNIVRQVLIAF